MDIQFLQIQTIHTSIYTILYVQRNCRIQIFYKSRQSVHLMCKISCWIYTILYIQHICNIQIFYKIQTICRIQIFCKSVHLMYAISYGINAIPDIKIFSKSKQSEHPMYTISIWIYAILYIQHIFRIHILCKSK